MPHSVPAGADPGGDSGLVGDGEWGLVAHRVSDRIFMKLSILAVPSLPEDMPCGWTNGMFYTSDLQLGNFLPRGHLETCGDIFDCLWGTTRSTGRGLLTSGG